MYTVKDVKVIIDRIGNKVSQEKDYLGELDGKSGDGDLGLSMEAAFHAVMQAAEKYAGNRIDELLMRAAMDCNKAAPSTMGTLISSGIMALAKASKGKECVEDQDVVAMPRLFAEAIMARGGAKVGDKTILDALYPMADCVEKTYDANGSLKEAFEMGAETARDAAGKTAGMRATIGRARWLGERAAEYPDGGAVLCAVIAEAVVEK